MGIYMIVYSLRLVASQYVVSVKINRVYFCSVFVGEICSFMLCFILIPKLTEIGEAIALLISQVFQ